MLDELFVVVFFNVVLVGVLLLCCWCVVFRWLLKVWLVLVGLCGLVGVGVVEMMVGVMERVVVVGMGILLEICWLVGSERVVVRFVLIVGGNGCVIG